VRVAAVQHDIVWERPWENHARLAPRIADAAANGADLVVLAEMYATGFSMNAADIAEPADGPSASFLARQAEEHGVWVCGSVPTMGTEGELPTNRFVLAAPDGTSRHYDKMHPFTFAGEHERYRAGERAITVDVGGTSVTPFVCYDLRFADDFWAEAPHTDLYVVVANWPAARRMHWQTLLAARAIENQAYVVGVNRVGDGDGIAYCGDSRVIGPFGDVLAAADPDREQTVIADVDPHQVREVRSRYPFLRDRRTFPG
jgi:predicted amidohydrolase